MSKLRQRIRKHNKDYDKEIADFKNNPDAYPEEEKLASEKGGAGAAGAGSSDERSDKSDESESGSDDDSESESDSDSDDDKPSKARRSKPPRDDDDEDSIDWSMSDSDESTDSGDDLDQEDIWKKFLKDDNKKESSNKKDDKKIKKSKQVKEKVDSDQESVKPQIEKKLFAKDEEINHTSVLNKLNEIVSTRGRKGTDRNEQIDMIKELRSIAKQHNLGPAIDIKILFNQIACSFDYNTRLNKSMKPQTWNECLKLFEEMLDSLVNDDNIETSEDLPDEQENVSDEKTTYKIRGSILAIFDRLSEEFIRILQQCDAHGTEYVERLKDEPKVCALIDRLIGYLERKTEHNKQDLCHIYLKKVENMYYKYDKNDSKKSSEMVDKLCKYIYTNDSTDRLRTKAMLCHIYHNALHDRWFEARDLMLMSHLQESIDSSDIPLQILYNRTMVQIGLCAFRVGNIKESHAALLDIQVGNRAKELLAQGLMVQRNVEKSKEQEIKERQRLIPFHMHINLELIECIYLVSAMLIEIPYMCSRDFETKKRMISKQFHYQLKSSERQPVVGPPENMREHVVAASRAMRNGDWRGCVNYLINEKMNAKVWNLMAQSGNVKTLLTEKIKEESLRTYLFRYSTVYESMSIETLAEMFELPRAHVYSIISKMIINEDLMASLDEPTQTIVMHRTEPTKLQTLAMQLSEKISNLMDQTERMVQFKGGEISAFMTRNQRNLNRNPNFLNSKIQSIYSLNRGPTESTKSTRRT